MRGKPGETPSIGAIAGELDVPVDAIVKDREPREGKRFVRIHRPDNVHRIGLPASGRRPDNCRGHYRTS